MDLVDGGRPNGSFVNGTGFRSAAVRGQATTCTSARPTSSSANRPERRGQQSTARRPRPAQSIPLTETERKVLIALCRPIVESNARRRRPTLRSPRGAPERRCRQEAHGRSVRQFEPRQSAAEREAPAARRGRARLGPARPPRVLGGAGTGRLRTVIVVQAPTRTRSPSASGIASCGAIGVGSSFTMVPFVEPRSRTTTTPSLPRSRAAWRRETPGSTGAPARSISGIRSSGAPRLRPIRFSPSARAMRRSG